jgi:hypothetical protein
MLWLVIGAAPPAAWGVGRVVDVEIVEFVVVTRTHWGISKIRIGSPHPERASCGRKTGARGSAGGGG